MFLRREKVNQKLRNAGIPAHIICRKRFPRQFGLIGESESNIIFDESQNPPKVIAVIGWDTEADRNTDKFITDWEKSNNENFPIF